MVGPTQEFWQQKLTAGHMPWDRGAPNPQILAWLDSGALAPCRILVPGCGTGHEVALLAQRGFEVTALDYAPAALALTQERLDRVSAPATLVQADVLEWQSSEPFAAIYEQTCLCALHPDRWGRYARQLDAWLSRPGKLFALLMQVSRSGATQGAIEGPPYHCDINAVRALLTDANWEWPAPPYARVPHSGTWFELATVLAHRRIP